MQGRSHAGAIAVLDGGEEGDPGGAAFGEERRIREKVDLLAEVPITRGELGGLGEERHLCLRCSTFVSRAPFAGEAQDVSREHLVGRQGGVAKKRGLLEAGLKTACHQGRRYKMALRLEPTLGQTGFGADFKGAAIRLHCLIEQRSGLASTGALSLVHQRTSEIVLRSGPTLGQICSRVDLERAAIRLHCLIEQGNGRGSTGAPALPIERKGEIVLRPGPVLGQIGLGVNLKNPAKCLRRLVK